VKRIRNLSSVLPGYIHRHTAFIIIIAAAFLVGLIAAIVFGAQAPTDTVDELRLYLDDFFHNMDQSGADPVALLKRDLPCM